MEWELAQVNVSDSVAPLGSPRLAGFRQRALPLDQLARRSPGFVWRPEPADLDPAELALFGDLDRTVVNLSMWESVEALRDYVYAAGHAEALRLRRRWFVAPERPTAALWWVPAGGRPTFTEAHRRLEHLRAHGPSAEAFSLRAPLAPPALPETA